jgi:hypothetical protein
MLDSGTSIKWIQVNWNFQETEQTYTTTKERGEGNERNLPPPTIQT